MGTSTEEGAHAHAGRRARAEEIHEVRDGQPGVDDVFDQQNVFAGDGLREVFCNLHDAARLGPGSVRSHAEKVDAKRQVDRAREVGGEDEAPFEYADEHEVSVDVVARDLLAELAHAIRDFVRGEQRRGSFGSGHRASVAGLRFPNVSGSLRARTHPPFRRRS